MPADGEIPHIAAPVIPVRVVIISLDRHLAEAVIRARSLLELSVPGIDLRFHAAADWANDPDTLARCKADLGKADIIIASMLFLDDHIKAIRPTLLAQRERCDAIVGCMSAGEIVKLTRLGKFDMQKPQSGPMQLLKKLRGKAASEDKDSKKSQSTGGANQAKMLRRLPKLLRYVPGTAQDLRIFFLTMQYWLAGSEENLANMVKTLIDRYAAGPRACLQGALRPDAPVDYPDVGLYHPDLPERVTTDINRLPTPADAHGTVGVLIMRSYVLSGDCGHYDDAIRALENKGLRVLPAFASGLDMRPAIEEFFIRDNKPVIDALVSLSGFSLVGGPAYNDAQSAVEMLERLDRPYLAAHALEFQSLESWRRDTRGLNPIETTIMVAIPEIDGATGPLVFGGRRDETAETAAGVAGPRMAGDPERTARLADRVAKLVRLRQTPVSERRMAITLFNFPPNGGSVGTAASLDVFASLHALLKGLNAEGYKVDIPATPEALRARLLEGNAAQFGAEANVHARIPADHYAMTEPRLAEIEAHWGPAPGNQMTDGRTLHVLGIELGNIFIGVQPPFGYEGDPMRLLFEQGFAPTHAFANYYRWLRQDYDAHAVLHFGTHGALEFMPGKQSGMAGDCWPDSLIGDLPHYYFYAGNNPSEATIAKRRAAATTVSYLTPAVTEAGLYKELSELKALIERWRTTEPGHDGELSRLAETIQAQGAVLDLCDAGPLWGNQAALQIDMLHERLRDYEETLIPQGLHVAGAGMAASERFDLMRAMTGIDKAGPVLPDAALERLIDGVPVKTIAREHGLKDQLSDLERFAQINSHLATDYEIPALVHALGGGFVAPVPGGDMLHNPDTAPSGRNIHGFDPFKLPSRFAVREGEAQANRLLEVHLESEGALPETVAIVLWGTDNLKSEGAQIAQAMALLGAEPRYDSYGRLCGARLRLLEDLGRPRIDCVVTLSGIFRDLLPLQTKMLAEAALLAATADEPVEQNWVRKHALAFQAAHGGTIEDAALRVFSNADGAYGSNVNQMVESGCWEDEDELGDVYAKRKCFAYGTDGKPAEQAALLQSMLGTVDLAYQNLESVELGLTSIDHYFDTLGGIGRAVKKARGKDAPVYIGDETRGEGKVRTLADQMALETRTRTLNPKWYEGMLRHGYEGVRQIEAHVTNTMGWSATTGQVEPWVYQQITETFVLDKDLRDRLAELNPKSCAKVANRLLEASDRNYWQPDDATLAALQEAADDLEDRIEGIGPGGAYAPAIA